MSEYYNRLYKEAFRILGGRTPLGLDCGVLCEKSCCRGDSETGMLLFPFEKTELRVIENGGFRLAVCSGKCKRSARPLSCRLFPFFPCVNEKGKVTVAPDYRGFRVCPLIKNAKDVRFSRRFLYRVKKTGELLARDKNCLEFLRAVTAEIESRKSFLA